MQALLWAATPLGCCRVIAPCGPLSGCSHQVTTHQPIRITPDRHGHLAVAGTPADCIRLALFSLAREVRWVLSGINAGGNLGTDVFSSGTVAAGARRRFAACRASRSRTTSPKDAPIDWPRSGALDGPGAPEADGRTVRAGKFLECQSSPPKSGKRRAEGRFLPARSITATTRLSARGRHGHLYGDLSEPRRRQPRRTSRSVLAARSP